MLILSILCGKTQMSTLNLRIYCAKVEHKLQVYRIGYQVNFLSTSLLHEILSLIMPVFKRLGLNHFATSQPRCQLYSHFAYEASLNVFTFIVILDRKKISLITIELFVCAKNMFQV